MTAALLASYATEVRGDIGGSDNNRDCAGTGANTEQRGVSSKKACLENKQRSRCTPTRFNISAQQNWKNGAHTTQVKTEEPEESMKQRLAVCLLSITVLAAREMSTTPSAITKRWWKMRDFMWQTASTMPASARMKKDAAAYLTENPHSARQ